jgi:PAS domain S-box-containing protein
MSNDVIQPAFLSTQTASGPQQRLALTVVLISIATFLATIPFARVQLQPVWSFIPIYESALLVNDLITASLLFVQFSILRSRALLALACGYLFAAVMVIPHALTFPGLFAPTGLLGAGPQSTAWIYMFWHSIFPGLIMAYAILKNRDGEKKVAARITRRAILAGVTFVFGVAIAFTFLATAGQNLLPSIMDGNHYTAAMYVVVSCVGALIAAALTSLMIVRRRTVIDLWLMVVMCVWLFDVALSAIFNAGRFDVGFYAGRIYGLLASTFVLLVLLFETEKLFAQLVRLFEAEQTEHRLAMQESRRIFETTLDLIFVTDSQGNFLRVSPSSATILGYDPKEMTGRNAGEFICLDDLERTRQEMRLARRGHETRNFETRYARKDGSLVSLAWTGVWSEPEKRHFFIGRDITESKKAERALRESEQMARAIIDTALDAFVQLDEKGVICDWSPKAEEMFGWPRNEAIGQKLREIIVPKENLETHSERMAQFLEQSKNGSSGIRFDVPSLRRDGTEIATEISLTTIHRSDGYIINGFIRDVTESRAAEEQLRHAQKMEAIGQLTGGVAHDFNNMLTVITGTIDILADAVADKPQLAAIAKLISEAADRGAELTGHLLAFARKQPLQPRELDVNTLMRDSERLLRPTLGENVEIGLSLNVDVWPALVDPTQLTTALLNLAVNARDAMTGGGKLTLETNNVVLDQTYADANGDVQPGEYVLIAVSDTGGGIPEAIRKKIFEPFFTTKGVGKGTGLGLAMVYGFVKQSGGHIQVYSEQGYGTTFKIYLPRAGAQAKHQADPETTEIRGGSETIMIVEDDPMVLASVTAQFQTLGYRILSASNATEALALIDSGAKFDLLFTDVVMPGHMNGRELADVMAKRCPGLKVLFTSGYTQSAVIHHGRLVPGVLLLTKPYRKQDLARMLRRALDGEATLPAASETRQALAV